MWQHRVELRLQQRHHTRIDSHYQIIADNSLNRVIIYRRALRIETVVNDPTDLGVKRRLVHLPELQTKARDVNRRLLDHERVGQGCVLASPAFERIAQPSVTDGRRAPALRLATLGSKPWPAPWPSPPT